MPAEPESNVAERRRWNDEHWASRWPKREQLTTAVTDILLGHAGLTEGQKVLDVGSGGGISALAASRLVGETGSVVDADISAPLAAFARQRAIDQGIANVSFWVGDAQYEPIPGAPFDAAISQFGVMFFDEPEMAFANIHGHLVPGGRLAFACWQPMERNPWFVGPVLAPYIPPPPPPAPGKSPSGPFSLGEPERAREILASSGWNDVDRVPYDLVVRVDREAIVDDEQLLFLGVEEASFDDARRAVDEQLDRLAGSDGLIEAPLAIQIFTATA